MNGRLQPTHATHLATFGIPGAMLADCGVRSVSDADVRELLGLNGLGKGDDLSGILFPYVNPETGARTGARVRLDSPTSDGAKYVMEPGCRHLFFAPSAVDLLHDRNIPIIFVESEKAGLALAALAQRSGAKCLTIATGGCWGWRRKVGKRTLPDGATEDESGPSPDLDLLAWPARGVIIAFDSDVNTNIKVRKARRALAKELSRRGAEVYFVQIPDEDGVNGPDDYIAKHGDEATLRLLESRQPAEEEIPVQSPTTETANAERLISKYADDLRFCSDRGVWCAWNGAFWSVNDIGAVMRRMQEIARDVYREAANEPDEHLRKSLAGWAQKSDSRRTQENAAAIARYVEGIEIRSFADTFDTNPLLLNVKNGTVDLQSGELRPHRREDFLTKMVPIAYDAKATCPRFAHFLDETFPETELVGYLARCMGYFLSGLTSEQCWWLFHGGTATGKSTLVSILHGLLGPYALALPENFFLITKNTSDFATARLAGVRLATSVETNEGKRLDVAKIKMLTGGDRVSAALKYENFFTFKMQAKLILATNFAPQVPAGDDATWRRIRVVPFNRPPVAPEARIADFAEKLLKEEGPGILRLAVLGSQARFRDGLQEPEAVKLAIADYRSAEDVIQNFLNDSCVMERGAQVLRKQFYAMYAKWSQENGLRPMSAKKLSVELARLGIQGDLSTRYWLDLRLADPFSEGA